MLLRIALRRNPETLQCNLQNPQGKLSVNSLNELRPNGKVRRREFQETSSRPALDSVYVVGVITGLANYRACSGSGMHLSNAGPSPGLTRAFSRISG